MKNNSDRTNFVKACVKAHSTYWDAEQKRMQLLNNAYMTRFYQGQENILGKNELKIEVAIGYEQVESTIGSLFMQAPGVQVSADSVVNKGDAEIVQTLVNRFLQRKRSVIEQVSRLALIYPSAYLKLAPRESADPLERVDIRPIEPWNVIVDVDADCWQNQRYVGHIYWLSIPEAKKRFGSKDFKPVPKRDYFDKETLYSSGYDAASDLPEDFLYIQVVEMYDLVHDQLLFWSPNFQGGEALLDKSDIPVRDWDGTALPAIIPLYFSCDPSHPMLGYSSLARIYDQITEKNLARARMSSAVRRDARMYIYDKSMLDENALEQIAKGEDGALIPIEGSSAGAITLVPNPSVNPDHSFYLGQIEDDLKRGTLMAPFTRGEASGGVTAAEITNLQMYAHSEIGRLARSRDEAVERLSNVYLRLISLTIEDDDDVLVKTEEGARLLLPEYLEGKFNIAALDAGNSPMGSYLKQKSLTTLVQPLTFLGADRASILKELVTVYGLPKELYEKPIQEAEAAAQQQTQEPQEQPTAALQPLSETALKKILPGASN